MGKFITRKTVIQKHIRKNRNKGKYGYQQRKSKAATNNVDKKE